MVPWSSCWGLRLGAFPSLLPLADRSGPPVPRQWREEMPAYADESLAAAQQNPEAQARLTDELRRLYRGHGLDVDCFVARRPAVQCAVATFE